MPRAGRRYAAGRMLRLALIVAGCAMLAVPCALAFEGLRGLTPAGWLPLLSVATLTVAAAGGWWFVTTLRRFWPVGADGELASGRAEAALRRRISDDIAQMAHEWFWRQDVSGRFVDISLQVEADAGLVRGLIIGRALEQLDGFDADPRELDALRKHIELR